MCSPLLSTPFFFHLHRKTLPADMYTVRGAAEESCDSQGSQGERRRIQGWRAFIQLGKAVLAHEGRARDSPRERRRCKVLRRRLGRKDGTRALGRYAIP